MIEVTFYHTPLVGTDASGLTSETQTERRMRINPLHVVSIEDGKPITNRHTDELVPNCFVRLITGHVLHAKIDPDVLAKRVDDGSIHHRVAEITDAIERR